MMLAELCAALDQHGVFLNLTAQGKIRPSAAQPPPGELIEAIRAHRDILASRLQRGQLPDGRLDMARLSRAPGRCASCARWQGPDEYGDGLCPLGRRAHDWPHGNLDAPVMTAALHECAAYAGKGWQARVNA